MTASGKPSTELAFEPILNGVDFLDRAIHELLEAHDPRELKYAVLHLQAAVEILVKVRLQREGYEHIFEDPETADLDRWKQGEFRSVGLLTALTRLKQIADIQLTSRQKKAFGRLARERNKLQHFGSTSNQEVVLTIAGNAMEVLSEFIVTHLVPDAPDDEQAPLQDARRLIDQALREIDVVIHARMKAIAPALDRWAGPVIKCPGCTQLAWTFEIDSEDSVCHCCSTKWWEEQGQVIAERYAEDVLGEDRHRAAQGQCGWSVGLCPVCDEEALVDVDTRAIPDAPLSVCFQCGFNTSGRMGSCGDCGRATIDDDCDLCPDCFQYRIDKD